MGEDAAKESGPAAVPLGSGAGSPAAGQRSAAPRTPRLPPDPQTLLRALSSRELVTEEMKINSTFPTKQGVSLLFFLGFGVVFFLVVVYCCWGGGGKSESPALAPALPRGSLPRCWDGSSPPQRRWLGKGLACPASAAISQASKKNKKNF